MAADDDNAKLEEASPLPILRSAIAAAARIEPDDVIFCGDLARRGRTSAYRARAFHLYPLGMASHPYGEICLSVGGAASLRVEDRVLALGPGQIAVIDPQRRHCEGAIRRNDSYDLVWIIASSAQRGAINISSRRGRQWRAPWHHDMAPHCARQITDLLASWGPRPSAEAVEALGGLLLATMSTAAQEFTWQRFLSPAPEGGPDQRLRLIRHVRGVLDTRLDHPLTLDSLAELFHLTPNYLNSLFRRSLGEAIHTYVNRRRMEIALDLCRDSDLQIKQIAARVGFADPLYFSRAFARYHGCSPKAARSVAEGRQTEKENPA